MKYEINSSNITFNGKDFNDFFISINKACQICDVSYFVVGAFARDLVLEQIFNQPTGIATRDIDIAIKIDSWVRYKAFTDYLITTYEFKKGANSHEFISPKGVYTDIIPYGNIEENRSVSFPPNFDRAINMLGFEEVFNATLAIRLDKKIDLRVVSIEGITILKFIAWQDRQPDRISGKHSRDISLIFQGYYDAMISEFAIDYADLLDEPNFDAIVCGASALGRRLKQLTKSSNELLVELDKIFDSILKEVDNSLFIAQLTNATIWEYSYALRIVSAFISNFKA